ncbi:MAG: Fic family protein, partial [Candidatus Binatia bacterium]
VHPLIATAGLVLDFLCIHPFRDGNGRVSRLLTLLALYHHGYEVGHYISLERLVEEAKEDYYEVLTRSSQDWHEGKHDFSPWLNYFLAILRRACAEFEQRAGQVKADRGAKTQMVEQAIGSISGEFGITDLERVCPGVSRDMIRRLLRDFKSEGRIECLGRGPGAKWRRKGIYP